MCMYTPRYICIFIFGLGHFKNHLGLFEKQLEHKIILCGMSIEIHVQSFGSWLWIGIMAGSIKLFQFFQKINQILGICESPSNPKQWSRKTVFLILFAPCTISTFGFLLVEAKSVFDNAFGIFTLVLVISALLIYLLIVWQSENMLKSIEGCEKFIEKSKRSFCSYCTVYTSVDFDLSVVYHHIIKWYNWSSLTGAQSTAAYKEFIDKMEFFNKIFFIFSSVSVVFLFFSAAPYTFVQYYMYDKGEDSFYLFLRAWSVLNCESINSFEINKAFEFSFFPE